MREGSQKAMGAPIMLFAVHLLPLADITLPRQCGGLSSASATSGGVDDERDDGWSSRPPSRLHSVLSILHHVPPP